MAGFGDAFALMPPVTGSVPSGPMGRFFLRTQDMFNNNPEKFAIAADMLGQNLWAGNPFAGIGQHLGQSSLANKGVQAQNQERQQMLDALHGSLVNPNVYNGQQQPSPMLPGHGPITGKDQAGPTSVTLTNDGYNIKGNLRNLPAAGSGTGAGVSPPPTNSAPASPLTDEGPKAWQNPNAYGNYFNPVNPW